MLGLLLPKPKYTAPCNHCGRCCSEELCPAAELAFLGADVPCPAIKATDGKVLCGLVEIETLAGMDGMLRRALGIGCGCSMPDEGTTADEIEAFDKLSYITVYGPNVQVQGASRALSRSSPGTQGYASRPVP